MIIIIRHGGVKPHQGRGLLASVDPSSCPSAGLTLVRSLAEQIKGRLAYQGPPGFGVELRFMPL
ncbi:MAG: hypothetical protein ACOYM2_11785 [Rectinemataceae bacterium]